MRAPPRGAYFKSEVGVQLTKVSSLNVFQRILYYTTGANLKPQTKTPTQSIMKSSRFNTHPQHSPADPAAAASTSGCPRSTPNRISRLACFACASALPLLLGLPAALSALTVEGDLLTIGESTGTVRTHLKVEPNGTLWSGTGTGYDSTSATPTGPGTRLMWIPEKNAFRAGRILEDRPDLWDYAKLGEHSFAWGYNNLAEGYGSTVWGAYNQTDAYASTVWGSGNRIDSGSMLGTAWGVGNAISHPASYAATVWGAYNKSEGYYTTAWGISNLALGYDATVWGRENLVTGAYATAFGHYTEAAGTCATTWGRDGSAIGDLATSWGERSHADAYLSTAFGRDNIGGITDNPSGPDGDTTWYESDPLLEVGVGYWPDGKANALSLMKSGKTAIGVHTAHPEGDETLVVHGALQLGDYADPDTATPAAGALRYSGGDFEGYDGAAWHSLSRGGSAASASSLIDPVNGASVIVATTPGAVTIVGGRHRQYTGSGSLPPTAGNLLRMGALSSGSASSDYGANQFQWFGELEFPTGGAAVAYLYLGEAPMELWGYFDLTVTADYWHPGYGRGAITKRFPMAFTEWGNPENPVLIGMDEEDSQVTAATGGIVNYVTIGEVEVVDDQVRVPIYFQNGAHTVSGLHLSGMFMRAYNTPGYPYAEIEAHSGEFALDNAVEMSEVKLSGSLTLADGTELNGAEDLGSASASDGSVLVDPAAPESTVVQVAAGGGSVSVAADLLVNGALVLSSPQGDLSMGLFTAQ